MKHLDKLGIVGSLITALCCLGVPAVLSIFTAIGLPTSFILDRRGHSRKYHVGIQPKEVFEREILEILK